MIFTRAEIDCRVQNIRLNATYRADCVICSEPNRTVDRRPRPAHFQIPDLYFNEAKIELDSIRLFTILASPRLRTPMTPIFASWRTAYECANDPRIRRSRYARHCRRCIGIRGDRPDYEPPEYLDCPA